MARGRRSAAKVNLRAAYTLGGYSGEYSWFIREKVIPIIGEAALHYVKPKASSRIREYAVTARNFQRVLRSLGISQEAYEQHKSISRAVKKAGPDETAALIQRLAESTVQPEPTEDYPLRFRIPTHPFSHNKMYVDVSRTIKKCTKDYTAWKDRFANLMDFIVAKDSKGVDLSKPVRMSFYYGHREKSDGGHYFDRRNFDKATQDCVYSHFGLRCDHLAMEGSFSGEFVDDYSDGFIEVKVRNL